MKYIRGQDIIQQLAETKKIENIDLFLYPDESALHSPYLLDNIEIARDMIVDAVESKKKVSIYVDCDFDGNDSTAIMKSYLDNFTDNVDYFHVERSDGHGLEQAIDKVPDGTELLIIVDSSTSSTEACKVVSKNGIPIIILDHHLSEQDNPYALIVNPQLDDYPNKYISGSVVTWKMCQVLDDYFGTKHAKHFIDLAGLGLIADQMSMLEPENRYIVHKALTNIKNLGIKAIFDYAKKDINELTTTDIQFTVAPQINAAARLDRMRLSLEILMCDDPKRCKQLAKELHELNEERKEIQAQFVKKFEEQIDMSDKMFLFIDEQIGKGFAGLVAGELANKYQRPVMVLSPVEDRVHGSFRTYEDFQMKTFLKSCPQVDFTAGHIEAGGLGLYQKDVADLKMYINSTLKDHRFDSDSTYDIEIDITDVDEMLVKKVQHFNRITGNRIKPAKFKVNSIFVSDKQLLGKKKNTVKLLCGEIDILKFRTNEAFFNNAPIFSEITAIGSLNLNVWEYYDRNKRRKVKQITRQLFLEDYQIVS